MIEKKCIANDNHIVISFKHSVKDKRYTIERKVKNKEKCNDDIKILFEKLNEISNTTWRELGNKPKDVGYEMIPINSFNVNMENIKKELKLSDDSKIIVLRFGKGQKYRILGVRCKACSSILYIIGYDWDFSAYNHN